jgi:hypothetical protein
MAGRRITKRVVDALRPQAREFAVWDSKLTGFGVRVRPSGAMSYVVVYRAGSGRGAPVRRFTIANVGKATPEAARRRARAILGAVAHGHDPAGEKAIERGTLTIAGLADRFMSEHTSSRNASLEPSRSTDTCSTRSSSRNSAPARSTRSRARRSRGYTGSSR